MFGSIKKTSLFEEETSCSKLRKVLENITIEPVIFCYLLAGTMQGALTTNLLHDKVCLIQFKLSEDHCKEISGNEKDENEIQRSVSQLNMYLKLIQNIPAILFVLFLGSWSDKHGRKIPIILPLAGSFVASLICMINSYFWTLAPEYILLAAVPRAVTGGSTALMMASYSYVSDKSEPHSRTSRFSFVDLMFTISSPIGFYLSDVLYTNIGYTGVYAIGSGIFLLAILYVVLFIDNSHGSVAKTEEPLEKDLKDYSDFLMTKDCEGKNIIDPQKKSPKRRIWTCLKRGENSSKVLLLMMNICLMNIVFGSLSLDFLYVKKKFAWTYSQYIHLTFTQYILLGVCSSVILPILSFRFLLEEFVLGALGCLSKVSGSLIQAFAYRPWHLYLACFTSCMEGMPLSVARSKISKLVPSSDLGKTFSVLACWESVAPLISNPLYTLTYNATLDIFPGTIYLITAAVHSLATIIFIILLIQTILLQKSYENQFYNCNIEQHLITADDVRNY